MKWRKINRIIHRDLGYFFFGMTVIYALSGIALNHIDDWNPSYIINTKMIQVDEGLTKNKLHKEKVKHLLANIGEEGNYKKHYFPSSDKMKVFVKNGSLTLNLKTGEGELEKIKKRPVFNQINVLHYNNIKNYWTIFSDIFAGSLILIAISGLFILRGKKGIKGRGAWLTIAGIAIPVIFLIIYL